MSYLKLKDSGTIINNETILPHETLKDTLKEAIKEVGPIPVIETKNKKITI